VATESFARVIAVDFSAAAVAVRGANSLWVAVAEGERPVRTSNPPTRAALADALTNLFERPGRSLVVLDVALGWPSGLAAALGLAGAPRAATVALLDELVSDGPDNANNRFEVADELNRRSGAALFWGHPPGRRYRWLSATTTPPRTLAPRPFDARRLIERDVGGVIKSPMQLSGAGAVGGQSMMAQVFVHRLAAAGVELAVWPFETREARVVVGESFFSLAPWRAEAGAVSDQRQARAVARGLRGALARGADVLEGVLATMAAPARATVRREEGWLVGWTPRGSLRGDARGH
jgi:hypothetical protein